MTKADLITILAIYNDDAEIKMQIQGVPRMNREGMSQGSFSGAILVDQKIYLSGVYERSDPPIIVPFPPIMAP